MVDPAAWEGLLGLYGQSDARAPFRRIVEIAKLHGVRSVVVERRYIDQDWRSERAKHYGNKFQEFSSVCHRLHFFTERVRSDLENLRELTYAYRGYAVMRPLSQSPVGRTMIAPPPELDDGIFVAATDVVDLFGWPFTVRAMPFISQDAEYLRCAHADLWMVLYHAHLAHGMPRRLPEHIHDAARTGLMVGRQVPSEGLSISQLLGGANQLGLSPSLLPLPQTRAESESEVGSGLSLFGILCRYVNSQLPPIVVSEVHAWVVVGYQRAPSSGSMHVRLWRHDDARGPYLPIDDPWDEPEKEHRPWNSVVLPLLPKMHLDAERAEVAGRYCLEHFGTIDPSGPLAKAFRDGSVAFRTYAIRSTEYKQKLMLRGVDERVSYVYRRASWPRYLWVVEAVDRIARGSSEQVPDVLGEAIFDSTTNMIPGDFPPEGLLAVHGDSFMRTRDVDLGPMRTVDLDQSVPPYLSGRPGR